MNLKTDYKDAQYTGEREYEIADTSNGKKSIKDVTEYSISGDQFGAKDINETNAAINRVARILTAVIPASKWSSTAPYKQTVSVSGIASTDRPDMALDKTASAYASSDSGTRARLQAEFGYIDDIETGSGKIIVTCNDYRPSKDIPVSLRGC